MYNVYVITLPKGEVYVGCTNDIINRKNQHNENARKRKNRFATYVADNYPNLKLIETDLKIIATFEDRNEALKFEKKTAKSYIGKTILLNDNYNIDCSRKGKNIGNTAKSYVLIDIENHSETIISNLRQYCIKNNLSYKDLQRTTNKIALYNSRYKCFYENEWLDIEDKEYYLSGKFYKEHLENSKNNAIIKMSKTYLVKTPMGELVKVTNLDKFAREHNLSAGTLHSKGGKTNGYMVVKRY